jgi:hypothetical protein
MNIMGPVVDNLVSAYESLQSRHNDYLTAAEFAINDTITHFIIMGWNEKVIADLKQLLEDVENRSGDYLAFFEIVITEVIAEAEHRKLLTN